MSNIGQFCAEMYRDIAAGIGLPAFLLEDYRAKPKLRLRGKARRNRGRRFRRQWAPGYASMRIAIAAEREEFERVRLQHKTWSDEIYLRFIERRLIVCRDCGRDTRKVVFMTMDDALCVCGRPMPKGKVS